MVGGHATVGRLSNNVFGRFKQLGKILKKVAERSRDCGRRSRDRRPTVKQRFWTFQAIRKFFEKSHCVYPTIFPFVDPGPSSLDFSRESPAKDMWCYVAYVYNGKLVSLTGNQRVGIFPPKSKILFVLSLALK